MTHGILIDVGITAFNVGVVTAIFFRMGGFVEFKRAVEKRLDSIDQRLGEMTK